MGRNNRRVKGGRGPVLEKFRTDQSIRALLLPVSAGANGINLTEATHVFFANPLLSAEEEAQAIGRVHRIGQTKTTTVHHFYIKDTIESRIVARTSESGSNSMQDKARASALLVKAMLNSARIGRSGRGRGRGRDHRRQGHAHVFHRDRHRVQRRRHLRGQNRVQSRGGAG